MRTRTPRIVAGLVVAALAAVALYLGGRSLSELAGALSEHRPVIASEPWAGATVVLGVVGLSLAAVLILAKPGAPVRRRSRRRGAGWGAAGGRLRLYLALALIGVVAALVAPMVQRAAVQAAVAPHGYSPCPPVPSPRRQPDRWARPVDICPVRDETPTS